MKLTENLPDINNRTFLVYLMSVDLNGFQGSGSTSRFMVTKWLPQIQTSHPHQACPETNSRAARAARMSFRQRPLFLPPPFFLKNQGEHLFQKHPQQMFFRVSLARTGSRDHSYAARHNGKTI